MAHPCGVCAVCSPADANAAIESWQSITFDGAPEKAVAAGERFASDPVRLNAPKSVWLCFEITFEGTKLPYLEEAIIPLFREENGRFVPSKKLPLPAMIACDRPVFKKIAFLGDSITEGIGTPIDSYAHWAARVADKMGDSYGYWNLGIGFARASDAASDGAWLAKARKADLVNVCLGVNDILHGQTTVEALKAQLALILRLLKEAGCQVGLFTVPPCDGPLERGAMWREVNRFIREELAPQADYVFDVTQIWGGFPVDPSRYGGLHPNAAGCEALAEAYVRDAKIQSVWRSSI